MYNKDYQAYLNGLRAREVRPPIEQIARLIATAPVRPSFTIPLVAKFLGALAICGMVALGYWALSTKFRGASAPAKSAPLSIKHVSPFSREFHAPKFHAYNGSHFSEIAGTIFAESKGPVQRSGRTDSIHASLAACPVPDEIIPFHPIANAAPMGLPIPVPTSEQATEGKFFVSLGGSIAQQFSSNATYRQTSFSDAFLGIGYDLSQYSSVRILAGEEAFKTPSNTTTNSIAFHDTTFLHNGQSYQNVIGEIQGANIPILTRIYWLGASYRYTLGDVATPIRPFAELTAAGSTDGFLSHQSLGAEFTASNRIDLDLLFEASELLPQNSAWLTKAGFAAAVSYRW